MRLIVNRTVTLIAPESDGRFGQEGLLLTDFESDRGYVLLGEPGMGKSTEFHKEAERLNLTPPVPARQFIRGKPENHPEWRNGPLFIDGLDEVRAAGGDPREVLDKIIGQLEDLGTPQFRLSCRSGHWFGAGDQEELASLLNSETIPVLQLNPLNSRDIVQIISAKHEDADAFILQAYEHGLESFLSNPQLLNVLLESVGADNWPGSPGETFENACKALIREQNREHQYAHSSTPPPSRKAILNAAGQLFALLLITGKVGWTVNNTENPDILAIHDIEDQERPPLHAALNSRLFEGEHSCRVPIHRLLAEYLGAQYLDRKIADGLSIRRVFALLTGYDGGPFPDLRGLAGWLASANPQARAILIQSDPIAAAFNGDASNFNAEERGQLLENLEDRLDLIRFWPSAATLGALAGNRDTPLVWELTGSPARSENRQRLVYMLLRGVSQIGVNTGGRNLSTAHIEHGCKNLLEVIYDSSWRSNVRCEALRALSILLKGNPDRQTTLRGLIKDLNKNRLSDHCNDLRGILLQFLYPGELHPREVWDYLAIQPVRHHYDSYLQFWNTLVERSQEDQIRELIDSLCNRTSEVLSRLANQGLADNVLSLLARGLELSGDNLKVQELYRWFELVEFDIFSYQLIPAISLNYSYRHNRDASTAIHNWLRERREVQNALIEYGLLVNKFRAGTELLNKTVGLKFIGESAPAGFRIWCLERAIELWNSQQRLAEELADWSIRQEEGWGMPLSDDTIAQLVSHVPGLCEWNDRHLQDKIQAELKQTELKKKQADSSPFHFDHQRQRDLEYLHLHIDELAEGQCSPPILRDLARVYVHALNEPEGNPRDALQSYLNGDQGLTQAALAGFRNLLGRNDLPDLEEIATFLAKKQESYFALPFFVGMEEQERETGDALHRLSETGKRRALGFYLTTNLVHHRPVPLTYPPSEANLPVWYETALESCPNAVSDALVAIHKACVCSKSHPNEHLFKMAYEPKYISIARLSVKRMFTVFPTRCTRPQLESLRVVLWAAILAKGLSDEELRKLTLRRLKRKSMDLGQRAQWLCAGLIVAHDICLPLLAEFLTDRNGSRVHRIITFLVPSGHASGLLTVNNWDSKEIAHLIQILGEQIEPPIAMNQAGVMSNQQIHGRDFEGLFTSWIHVLSRRTDASSARELDSLVLNPNLSEWTPILLRAQEDQSLLRRAEFRPELTLTQIQKALQNDLPVSAADLVSITVDALEQLANDIRNEDTSDWKQYWYWDQKTGIHTNPQDENYCRNALLSDLKRILKPYQIDAQPEGQYADDKRADIRVCYGSNLAIPIEIKKNSSRDLWRGITEQLVPKYTRDPKADGNGIYLVFWFGAEQRYMRIAPSEGDVPAKPEDLKRQLEQGLRPTLKNKIHVVVVDVSPST